MVLVVKMKAKIVIGRCVIHELLSMILLSPMENKGTRFLFSSASEYLQSYSHGFHSCYADGTVKFLEI